MTEENEYYKIIVEDPRYAEGPKGDEFPKFESLKLTIARTLPYWDDVIVPQIKVHVSFLIVLCKLSKNCSFPTQKNVHQKKEQNCSKDNIVHFLTYD